MLFSVNFLSLSEITIPSNCEKSGTNVDKADVNLVKAIIKTTAQNNIYITFTI